jgi:hypothetical protein
MTSGRLVMVSGAERRWVPRCLQVSKQANNTELYAQSFYSSATSTAVQTTNSEAQHPFHEVFISQAKDLSLESTTRNVIS